MHNVGVDGVAQRHDGDGGAGLITLRHNLELEFGTEKSQLGDFDASLARHGVYDIHGAHYWRLLAPSQDVFAARKPPFSVMAVRAECLDSREWIGRYHCKLWSGFGHCGSGLQIKAKT